ncbi:MAG: peptidylprolyl isomerase [Candidatus Zixiibacteriota bacterium]|jgi:hypothetical protein
MANTGSLRTAAFALLSSALLYYAPAAGTDVLATVDGEPVVTLEDLSYYLGTAQLPAGVEIKAADVEMIVETIVNADIVLREAEALGYADDPALAKEVADYRHARLRERMREALVEQHPVTEDDLRAYYEKDSKWRKYAVIETKNRADAEAAYDELRAGKPWAEVVRTYTIREETGDEPGAVTVPMIYDGLTASEAVFATPVGEYTPPTPANDHIRWNIYRVDKVVHGRTDTYEEAHTRLRYVVEQLRGHVLGAELASELRGSVTIRRNEEFWNALREMPLTEFHATWALPDITASDVGGIVVTGADFYDLIGNYFLAPDEGLETLRADDADDFFYVADRLLHELENEALIEHEALRRGLDREPEMEREFANHRGRLITEKFITREFTAKLPPVTAEDCAAYYEAHKDEFVVPEKVEVYLVALPDREELTAFHEEIAAGGNIVEINEALNQAMGRELMDMYEAPPVLPPEEQEWRGVVAVTKAPGAEGPDGPFAAALRPRLFPFDPEGPNGLRRLGEVFELNDGRGAFYEPIYYQPRVQKTLDDDSTFRKCQKKAWAEYYAGEEVWKLSLEWLASLRSRHEVVTNAASYEAAAARLNRGEEE